MQCFDQTWADSAVRVYCTVPVRQNLQFSVGRVFECPDFEFELDFDRQTPSSNSGQNLDSAVRRRLILTDSTQESGRESF